MREREISGIREGDVDLDRRPGRGGAVDAAPAVRRRGERKPEDGNGEHPLHDASLPDATQTGLRGRLAVACNRLGMSDHPTLRSKTGDALESVDAAADEEKMKFRGAGDLIAQVRALR